MNERRLLTRKRDCGSGKETQEGIDLLMKSGITAQDAGHRICWTGGQRGRDRVIGDAWILELHWWFVVLS